MGLLKYEVPIATTGFLLCTVTIFGNASLQNLSLIFALGAGMAMLQRYMKGGQYYGTEKIPGKTVIITGANSGVGKETARELAKRGGRIIMACRDMASGEAIRKEIIEDTGNQNILCKKLDLTSLESVRAFCRDINNSGRIIMACRDMASGEAVRKEIIEDTGNQNILCKKLDLTSLESVRAFCRDINNTEGHLDILINNAGIMMCPKSLTEDGIEKQFGTNHIGHFLLTNLLLDKLKASAPSRIIIVSSLAHKRGKIHFDDINLDKNYSGNKSYGQSKLANLLHVHELAKRLEGTGVTVNGLHPGVVDTNLPRYLFNMDSTIVQALTYPIRSLIFKSPAQGAQTTLRLALDPALETVTGKYFSDCKETAPSPSALDDVASEHLWKISEELTIGGKN